MDHVFARTKLCTMLLQKCNAEDLNSVALWVLRTVIQTIIPMDRHSPLIVSIHLLINPLQDKLSIINYIYFVFMRSLKK